MLMRYKSPQIKVAILRVRRACIRVIFVLNCYFKVLVCWKIVDAFIFMSWNLWNYNKNWRKCSQILGTHFKSQSEVCVLCILVLRVYVHVWRCLEGEGHNTFSALYVWCGSIKKSTFYRLRRETFLVTINILLVCSCQVPPLYTTINWIFWFPNCWSGQAWANSYTAICTEGHTFTIYHLPG